MRAVGVVTIVVCLPMCGLAQGVSIFGGSSLRSANGISTIHGNGAIRDGGRGPAGVPTAVGSLQTNLRVDPPTGALPQGLNSDYHGRGIVGKSYFTRIVMDSVNHEYFGYEVLLEEQKPGTYLATFGKPGVSPMEAAATASAGLGPWSVRTLALREPRVVRDGDIISVELMTFAATGGKLIDDITIQPFSQRPTVGLLARPGLQGLPGLTGAQAPPVNRAVPTVEGTARDFSAADAEMRLSQLRATINGTPQSITGRAPNVTGSLVWFYLPGRGRYILSLVPRPQLDFQKAGEVRGGAITLTLGGDAITLEPPLAIAAGNAPYVLYVLRDPEWEPTTLAQKGQFAVGSVAAEELTILERH
jgi:hypothetical protein